METDYEFEALRDWVLARYGPAEETTKDAAQVLLDVSQNDEQAFELFFRALDAAIAAQPDKLVARGPGPLADSPQPTSAFLDVLAERPGMFLRRASVGCLRAFLDGYSLAAIEQGHPECADLDGFEH